MGVHNAGFDALRKDLLNKRMHKKYDKSLQIKSNMKLKVDLCVLFHMLCPKFLLCHI